jgi:hypothetical protein
MLKEKKETEKSSLIFNFEAKENSIICMEITNRKSE